MTVAEILDDVKKRRQVREFKSACCGAPVSLVYQTLTSARVAIVVTCTKCDRLHAFDSRDDAVAKLAKQVAPDIQVVNGVTLHRVFNTEGKPVWVSIPENE